MTAGKKSSGDWRKSVRLSGKLSELANKLAPLVGIDDAGDLSVDPGEREARTATGNLIFTVIEASLEQMVAGSGGYKMGDSPEPFFERTRTEKKDGEKLAQRAAIAKHLDLDKSDRIVISEVDLVGAALKAARRFNSNYDVQDLIRDGVRRVAQELITNAANEENTVDGAHVYRPVQGANWAKYEQALQTLRAELNTKAWPFRKPYITLSAIASTVVGNTNVVQIRRWLDATGQKRIPSPDHNSELYKKDETLAGAIVDPALDKV